MPGPLLAEAEAPEWMRAVLERTRLSLRVLFRALDRLARTQELPDELRELFELDADLAEALWVLDQPEKRFDVRAMTRDTAGSWGAIPAALRAVLGLLDEREQRVLSWSVNEVRAELKPSDAYLGISGRDPNAS